MNGANQRIPADELARVRSLDDLDLRMLLSEIHDHGWPVARKLLPLMSTPGNTEQVQS